MLTVTQMLRAKGVVGRFVEFFGPGLDALSLADRATIANMAPEYGATCGFFPIDERTIDYLKLTGRDDDRIELVRAYAKAQGMWRDASSPDPLFTDTLDLDMSSVQPSLAGPKRPQDKVLLSEVDDEFNTELEATYKKVGERAVRGRWQGFHHRPRRRHDRRHHQLHQYLQPVGAGRRRPGRAQGARARPDGKPWVKTSLAPGSQVVTDYLDCAGLSEDLNAIGFNLVGYGCTTCIGNSGPLDPDVQRLDRRQ